MGLHFEGMKLLNSFPLVIEARIQCSLCFLLDSLFFRKYFASFTGRGELVLLGIPLPHPELLQPCADHLRVRGQPQMARAMRERMGLLGITEHSDLVWSIKKIFFY